MAQTNIFDKDITVWKQQDTLHKSNIVDHSKASNSTSDMVKVIVKELLMFFLYDALNPVGNSSHLFLQLFLSSVPH